MCRPSCRFPTLRLPMPRALSAGSPRYPRWCLRPPALWIVPRWRIWSSRCQSRRGSPISPDSSASSTPATCLLRPQLPATLPRSPSSTTSTCPGPATTRWASRRGSSASAIASSAVSRRSSPRPSARKTSARPRRPLGPNARPNAPRLWPSRRLEPPRLSRQPAPPRRRSTSRAPSARSRLPHAMLPIALPSPPPRSPMPLRGALRPPTTATPPWRCPQPIWTPCS